MGLELDQASPSYQNHPARANVGIICAYPQSNSHVIRNGRQASGLELTLFCLILSENSNYLSRNPVNWLALNDQNARLTVRITWPT